MNPDTLIFLLRERLSKPLPGESAHIAMAPMNRPLTSLALKEGVHFKESAVSILIHSNQDKPSIIFIQRPFYEGAHSGQISFPGGKKDPDDESLEFTARRECFEEIGVTLSPDDCIGKLTNVYIPVSQFLVVPYLYHTSESLSFKPDPREVAEIFSVSFESLMRDDCISTMEVKFPNGLLQKNIPCFILENKKIWGATALVLNELRTILFDIY